MTGGPRTRLVRLGAVLLVAAAVVLVLVLVSGSGGDDAPERRAGESVAGQGAVAALFAGIPQDGLAIGDPGAPVTIVEFADMQCPFCADFATKALPGLVDDLRAGRVRIEFQPLQFLGPDSERMAGVVAAAAAQDRAWPVLDLLFINQGRENSGFATDDFLREILGAVDGLDVDRVLAERTGPAVREITDEASRLAAQAEIEGTPAFLAGPTGGERRRLDVRELSPAPFESAVRQFGEHR